MRLSSCARTRPGRVSPPSTPMGIAEEFTEKPAADGSKERLEERRSNVPPLHTPHPFHPEPPVVEGGPMECHHAKWEQWWSVVVVVVVVVVEACSSRDETSSWTVIGRESRPWPFSPLMSSGVRVWKCFNDIFKNKNNKIKQNMKIFLK